MEHFWQVVHSHLFCRSAPPCLSFDVSQRVVPSAWWMVDGLWCMVDNDIVYSPVDTQSISWHLLLIALQLFEVSIPLFLGFLRYWNRSQGSCLIGRHLVLLFCLIIMFRISCTPINRLRYYDLSRGLLFLRLALFPPVSHPRPRSKRETGRHVLSSYAVRVVFDPCGVRSSSRGQLLAACIAPASWAAHPKSHSHTDSRHRPNKTQENTLSSLERAREPEFVFYHSIISVEMYQKSCRRSASIA
jgi:hypothetical protein